MEVPRWDPVEDKRMQKTDVEYLEFMWPMRHYLITCAMPEDGANIIAVSFCMPVSKEPPMLACAIGHNAYSCGIIEETGEYVVNVPPQELKSEIYYCGFHSGKDIDKFRETGLTPQQARRISVPIIRECVAHMECRVEQVIDTGDKRLFIGKVVESYADEDLVKGRRVVEYAAGEFPKKIYGIRFLQL
jgi:flavin reductase (DIM6/NTAB) family NADH-FMN oxidoreductase RutF